MFREARGERDFDVVLYGATGFTGRQTVQHFAKPFGLYGDGIAAACVKTGTHYVDITEKQRGCAR